MLHRKIVEPILAELEGEESEYFSRVMQRLEEDKRLEAVSNLIYLSLRETIPYIPIYLPVPDFVDALFKFVSENRRRLNMAIFDRSYIEGPEGPERLRLITNEFVARVLELTLEKYDDGEVTPEEERKVYRFSSTDDEIDFPYKDIDSDEG